MVLFSSTIGTALSVSDLDAGSNPVQVTLTATNGTLNLSGTAGLAFSTGDGTVVITNSDDSDFAVGFYGRAGIDFRIGKDQFLGLGVRYMAAEMDFDKTIGKLDLEGPQIVLAYTAYL